MSNFLIAFTFSSLTIQSSPFSSHENITFKLINRKRLTGNLSMREILVLTSALAYVRAYVPTDSGGRGGEESEGNPTGEGECHLFLAGNRAVLLGNYRFSWREIAKSSFVLKKRFL